MVDYGLKDRVALITGANNPQGIGATTAFAFAREGANVVLVYKRIPRPFDVTKTDKNGADRYFQANAGNADIVKSKLQEMDADYLIIERRGNLLSIVAITAELSIFPQMLHRSLQVRLPMVQARRLWKHSHVASHLK